MKISCKIGEIDTAIKAVREYKKNLINKTQILNERLAEIGINLASVKFRNAQYDGTNDVIVSSETSGNSMLIKASGSTVLFIEFGTGVKNPEHPMSDELGMHHGTYGKGKGKDDEWAYYGEKGTSGEFLRSSDKGDVYMTKGNPPAKAMYETAKELREKIEQIAKEVFGD